jgi:hypothetical protein
MNAVYVDERIRQSKTCGDLSAPRCHTSDKASDPSPLSANHLGASLKIRLRGFGNAMTLFKISALFAGAGDLIIKLVIQVGDITPR